MPIHLLFTLYTWLILPPVLFFIASEWTKNYFPKGRITFFVLIIICQKNKAVFSFFFLFFSSHERTNLFLNLKGRISNDLTPIFTENNAK